MRTRWCVACGRRDHLQVHHLRHKAWGGGDEETNLITLCAWCHAISHRKTLQAPPPRGHPRAHALLLLAGLVLLGVLVWLAPADPAAGPWWGVALFVLVMALWGGAFALAPPRDPRFGQAFKRGLINGLIYGRRRRYWW